MTYGYIPILRWKLGEKRGLKNVPEPVAKKGVCPLIVVTEETFADQPETARSEAMTASFLFADELTKHWGARPFYLDASHIRPSAKGAHPLVEAAKECRKQGARMTPATRLRVSDAYDAAVLNVAQTDKRGAAVTVSLREFTNAAEWVRNWPIALKETDLILDLEDTVSTVADLGSVLDMAFRNLHGAGKWRSVTVVGTSMPENFSAYQKDDVYLIERVEWTLWQHLISLSLPYRLDYGDYATVAITGAPSEVRTGFPINVRYTLPTQFLICRGVRTRGEGSRDQSTQLIAHAKTIVNYRGRHQLNCWADNTIDKIATKKESPSGLPHWVTIGVNRHIVRVRTDMP